VECGELLGFLLRLEDFPADEVQGLLDHCRRSQRLILGLLRKLSMDPSRSPLPAPRSPPHTSS
jgi:hypothetical protein